MTTLPQACEISSDGPLVLLERPGEPARILADCLPEFHNQGTLADDRSSEAETLARVFAQSVTLMSAAKELAPSAYPPHGNLILGLMAHADWLIAALEVESKKAGPLISTRMADLRHFLALHSDTLRSCAQRFDQALREADAVTSSFHLVR
jgi:hypothetical protein